MMQGLDFLFSPNSQAYEARQRMQVDDLKNEQMGLANQTTAASLPGVVGRSQSLAAQGQIDQAGMQDKINLAAQEHLSKMDDYQLKEVSSFGEKVGQVGAYLQNVPPLLRGQEYQNMMQRYRLPPIPGLDQLSPDQLPAALSKMGETMTLMSADSIKKRELERMQQAGALERQKTASQATVDAAGVRANTVLEKTAMDNEAKMQLKLAELEGKAKAAEQKAVQKEAELNIEKQLRALVMSPDFKTNPTKQGQYRDLLQTQTTIKAAGTNQTNADLLSGRPVSGPAERAESTANIVAPLSEPKAAPDTLDYYRQLYKGKNISDEQIKAAYKKKTGKDLK